MTLLDLINQTPTLSAFKKDGTDDQAIANVLNLQNIQTYNTIAGDEFLTWATPLGIRADIETWKTDADRITRSIAFSLQDIILRSNGVINFKDANNIQMLDYLISVGKINANTKSSLLSLSIANTSLSEINLGYMVSAGEVSIALRGA